MRSIKRIPKSLLKCYCCEEVSLQIVPRNSLLSLNVLVKFMDVLTWRKGVGDIGEWIMIVTRRNEIGGCLGA